eukprot:COSAG05_NODE_846_length_6998_cov_2.530077_1_plen_105_part_00
MGEEEAENLWPVAGGWLRYAPALNVRVYDRKFGGASEPLLASSDIPLYKYLPCLPALYLHSTAYSLDRATALKFCAHSHEQGVCLRAYLFIYNNNNMELALGVY